MGRSADAVAARDLVEVRIDDAGEALAALAALARAHADDGPPIRVVFTVHRGNVGQLYRLVRLCAALLVDEVCVDHVGDAGADASVVSDPAAEQWFGLAREEAARRGLTFALPALCPPRRASFQS